MHLEGTIKSFIMKLLHFHIPLGMFRSVEKTLRINRIPRNATQYIMEAYIRHAEYADGAFFYREIIPNGIFLIKKKFEALLFF